MFLTSSAGWWPGRCVSPAVPPPTCATSATLSVTREASPAAPPGPVLTTSRRTRSSTRTSAQDSILEEIRDSILEQVEAIKDTIPAVRTETMSPGTVETTAGTAATDTTPATLLLSVTRPWRTTGPLEVDGTTLRSLSSLSTIQEPTSLSILGAGTKASTREHINR